MTLSGRISVCVRARAFFLVFYPAKYTRSVVSIINHNVYLRKFPFFFLMTSLHDRFRPIKTMSHIFKTDNIFFSQRNQIISAISMDRIENMFDGPKQSTAATISNKSAHLLNTNNTTHYKQFCIRNENNLLILETFCDNLNSHKTKLCVYLQM